LLNRDQVHDWAAGRTEILMVSSTSIEWMFAPNTEPRFYTFEGCETLVPDDVLFAHLNPLWLLPDEVEPRPRDEDFGDTIEFPTGWDIRTWWYDTGNFGSVGLLVRTIAAAWDIDLATAINLMEPLCLQTDVDLRPTLPKVDGTGLRVTAIRMRRPTGPTS
jgi:hypothetical protein